MGSLTIAPGAAPSPSELQAAQLVADEGHDVTLRPPAGRRSPAGGTADLLVDGVTYDIYAPRTASVERIVSAVASKGNQAHGVVPDLSNTTVTRSRIDHDWGDDYDVQAGGWNGEPPDTWLSEHVLRRFAGKRVRVTVEVLNQA